MVLKLGASSLMSSLVLFKAFAYLVVMCWSPWISLAERSRSSFALVVSCVKVRNCFLFLVMPMRVVSGRSRPMRVGLHIGIIRLRALMDVILFLGEGDVLNVRETASTSSVLSFEVFFGLQHFFKLKT
jgi:hypothetical protein